MGKIHVMSENLANKIAAGEVVEKCSSIVKELVENSIDASSNNIIIHLIKGGLESINVIDDGCGMDSSDAKLAFGRHATSKLIRDDDLFFIDTMGFRGEALPSIASVAEVILKTSNGISSSYIHIKGGELIEESSCELRKGTDITVTNLFYNTPARLKYLKSENTENYNCVNLIEKLALAYPSIKFTLTNNGKVILKTSGSANLLKTIHEIYGLNISNKMLEFQASNNDFDIYGFICKPEILKSNRNDINTFVNDRVIKNMDINRAINDAYYTYKPEGKYPVVILKINADPTLVDVNIHPTKQDIKLSKMNDLYDLIYTTLKDTLYSNLLIPSALKNETVNIIKDDVIKNIVSNMVKKSEEKPIQTELDFKIESNPETNSPELKSSPEIIINKELKSLVLNPIGLAHGTYIIAENEAGIYLIDQHAAQERINYERYMKALRNRTVTTTNLLIPITVELSTSEYLILKDNLKVLTDMGFIAEEFGVNTIKILGHPTWILEGKEEESVRKIIDLVIINKDKFDPIKFNENIAITLACKMSIKANMHISMEAIRELLNELVLCDNPYNCPHGRPTIIKFSIYDLERMFKRVMN
ncbi:MAG: DNA mismatch repair endonuclease MutL [Bacilli bacterium]|jgi:DNA mismatch repair protein MutL|nr:DNA mismatch repair endonuclease MutL [Bacilli bacterium]